MRAILELMAPAELLDGKEETPAHTSVRIGEFLRQAGHMLSHGIDQLELELRK